MSIMLKLNRKSFMVMKNCRTNHWPKLELYIWGFMYQELSFVSKLETEKTAGLRWRIPKCEIANRYDHVYMKYLCRTPQNSFLKMSEKEIKTLNSKSWWIFLHIFEFLISKSLKHLQSQDQGKDWHYLKNRQEDPQNVIWTSFHNQNWVPDTLKLPNMQYRAQGFKLTFWLKSTCGPSLRIPNAFSYQKSNPDTWVPS